MNEIKCPNCGAVLVDLSEEHYLCEACGNKYPKHNFSKEFQKTDAHIEDVHKDLKEIIEKNIGGSANDDLKFENTYKAAMTFLDRGEIDKAHGIFSDLSEKRPWSYKGFYGMFLCQRRVGKLEYNCMCTVLGCEDVTEKVRQDIETELEKRKEEIENTYKAAMTSLNQGEVDDAYELFSAISGIPPQSYKGFYGMFLCQRRAGKFEYNCMRMVLECEDVTEEVRRDIEIELQNIKKESIQKVDSLIESFEKEKEILAGEITQMKATDPSENLAKAKEQISHVKPKVEKTAKVCTGVASIIIVLVTRVWEVVLLLIGLPIALAKDLVSNHPILGVIIIVVVLGLGLFSGILIVPFIWLWNLARRGILWLYKIVRPLVISRYEAKTQSIYMGDDLEEITESLKKYEKNFHEKNIQLEKLNMWQKEIEEQKNSYKQADPNKIKTYATWEDINKCVDSLSKNFATFKGSIKQT